MSLGRGPKRHLFEHTKTCLAFAYCSGGNPAKSNEHLLSTLKRCANALWAHPFADRCEHLLSRVIPCESKWEQVNLWDQVTTSENMSFQAIPRESLWIYDPFPLPRAFSSLWERHKFLSMCNIKCSYRSEGLPGPGYFVPVCCGLVVWPVGRVVGAASPSPSFWASVPKRAHCKEQLHSLDWACPKLHWYFFRRNRALCDTC